MEEKVPDVIENWCWNVNQFRDQMMGKISKNLKEKGLSWREMSNKELSKVMAKFQQRKDWVSVANIAFMIWENDWRTKISEAEEETKSKA